MQDNADTETLASAIEDAIFEAIIGMEQGELNPVGGAVAKILQLIDGSASD